jgi:hypothetical protein
MRGFRLLTVPRVGRPFPCPSEPRGACLRYSPAWILPCVSLRTTRSLGRACGPGPYRTTSLSIRKSFLSTREPGEWGPVVNARFMTPRSHFIFPSLKARRPSASVPLRSLVAPEEARTMIGGPLRGPRRPPRLTHSPSGARIPISDGGRNDQRSQAHLGGRPGRGGRLGAWDPRQRDDRRCICAGDWVAARRVGRLVLGGRTTSLIQLLRGVRASP